MRGVLGDGAIPLNSGAYSSRSLIADAQKCVNLFPEINPEETDPGSAVTHYPRPGLTPLVAPAIVARGRGVFTMSDGSLYAVSGPNVYYVDPNWAMSLIGQIANLQTPVSMSDNGTTAVLVDGSPMGYSITLANHVWNGPIIDTTGTFVGSPRADYVDTFLTFSMPGTNEWTCSLGLQVAFNALQTASKSSFPDSILTHAVNLRQVWLLGSQQSSEIWFLAGSTPFPFQEWPNTFVPYGCAATYSLARGDSNLFWLSRNKDGECIVVMTEGYGVKAITTRALEYRFTNYARVDDAVAYFYQQGGHSFYVIHFPTADESWGYDLSTHQWHQRVSLDQNGVMHREKVSFHAYVSSENGYPNTNVVQDWNSGQLYAFEQKSYTDNGMPIPFIRSFPHVTDRLHELTASAFVADISTGTLADSEAVDQSFRPWNNGWSNGFGPLVVEGAPQIACRLSKDGGATWGNYRQKGFVAAGLYRSMMRWRNWGMGRDLVFELAWAIPTQCALQGAYFEPVQHGS
jgi:hypothetical protein